MEADFHMKILETINLPYLKACGVKVGNRETTLVITKVLKVIRVVRVIGVIHMETAETIIINLRKMTGVRVVLFKDNQETALSINDTVKVKGVVIHVEIQGTFITNLSIHTVVVRMKIIREAEMKIHLHSQVTLDYHKGILLRKKACKQHRESPKIRMKVTTEATNQEAMILLKIIHSRKLTTIHFKVTMAAPRVGTHRNKVV
jgi:hypothetical protein